MKNRFLWLGCMLFATSSAVYAANGSDGNGRADYDLDDDGLIEINDLADLNEIRNNLGGSGLYGKSDGCPGGGCMGFELTTDLDFDSNGDDQITALDGYWNDGAGWLPIGSGAEQFRGHFNGNGYQIKNLMINRPDTDYIGLFGFTNNARLEKLALIGSASSIQGRNRVGALAGRVMQSQIQQIAVTARVEGKQFVAGLVGDLLGSSRVEAIVVSGLIKGDAWVAGIVGDLFSSHRLGTPNLSQLLATAKVETSNPAVDIDLESIITHPAGINSTNGFDGIVNAYWAKDIVTLGHGGSTDRNYIGLSLINLQCPQAANADSSSGCVSADGSREGLEKGVTLYNEWNSDYWDFGTDTQLPGLKFSGRVIRDGDGDGISDDDDNKPFDHDNDGVIDAEDSAPLTSLHDRADYDLDDDGLIEINNLTDLNEIRNNLDGSSLHGKSNGCPDAGCTGFELTTDLDFDTNGDGQITELDDYWSNGAGWQPIGSNADNDKFNATFNGNGHQIKNLMINRPDTDYIGLFGFTSDANVENLALTGTASSVVGDEYVGMLFGRAYQTQIAKIAVAAQVEGNRMVGGVVGNLGDKSQISAVLVSGSVKGAFWVSGVVGDLNVSSRHITETKLIELLSSVNVEATRQYGTYGDPEASLSHPHGINSSYALGGEGIFNSYWAKDIVENSQYSSVEHSYFGVNLTNLQCPQTANVESGCISGGISAQELSGNAVLYNHWGAENWDFGNANQLPGLKFGDRVVRDGDGDGIFDEDDARPFDFDNDGVKDTDDGYPLIALDGRADLDNDGIPDQCDSACQEVGMQVDADTDGDGIDNTVDAFVRNGAASVDADNDGLPDSWSDGCDAACRVASGLTLDMQLNDTDNDGVINPDDPDNNADNGRPVLKSVGPTMYTPVNNDSGTAFNASSEEVERLLGLLVAEDAVDSAEDLTIRAYLNGDEIIRNDNGGITIPVGKQTISWVAQDKAGNKSDAKEQQVFVYPQVKFASTASAIGEPDTAVIRIELSGASPEYPVDIPLAVVAADSTVSQEDIGASFNIAEQKMVRIEQGNKDNPNTSTTVSIPVLQEFIDEPDETLVLSIAAKPSSSIRSEFSYVLPEASRRHTLTVLDMKDTDRDGAPDECDNACQQVGKLADQDDDSDGILDVNDAYPTIAIGNHADNDRDGRPDECDTACVTSGMAADDDDDNDGVLDINDAFRVIAAASVDADNDGLPDSWNDSCDAACRSASGLMLDMQLNDTDNDGVLNSDDPDNSVDNGNPTLLSVATNIRTQVNSNNDTTYTATKAEVDKMFAASTALDVVDSPAELTFMARSQGEELIRDENGSWTLPSGMNVIVWTAVDQAGNESDSMEQHIYVYPKVRFAKTESIVGEASDAEVIVELTSTAPEYPITVFVKVNEQASSVGQGDINSVFDITKIREAVIVAGDDPQNLALRGSISIPILEDNMIEADELLVLELQSIKDASRDYPDGSLVENRVKHELTVTDKNLPPVVELVVEQGGVEVQQIRKDGGNVSIRAEITDPNGGDTHTVAWDLNSLGLEAPLGKELSFSPANLSVTSYTISVTVTDDGLTPLNAKAVVKLQVVEPPRSGGGGGSGGGALFWLILVLGCISIVHRRYRTHKFI